MSAFVFSVMSYLSSVLTALTHLLGQSRCFNWLAIGSLVLVFWLSLAPVAQAETAPELFEIHCAGCHPNGANIIRRGKNLKQRALKRHGYASADAIATLIANGKGLMSAYSHQLSADEINRLANYVLEQAAINWKSVQ